jgi:predicted nucleic acid-binding protein
MGYTVVYDACVLYPITLCDLLLRLANTERFQAKWTDQILDECFENLAHNRPDLSPERLAWRRSQMVEGVLDCIVTGYESLVDGLTLPDPDDRHVLAAAIRCEAQAIITFNLDDFPADALNPYAIEAIHPDAFVVNQMDEGHDGFDIVLQVFRDMWAAYKNPPISPDELLQRLERQRLGESVARLRHHFSA